MWIESGMIVHSAVCIQAIDRPLRQPRFVAEQLFRAKVRPKGHAVPMREVNGALQGAFLFQIFRTKAGFARNRSMWVCGCVGMRVFSPTHPHTHALTHC